MARKRASMREGPLAELFKATEAAQRQAEQDVASAPERSAEPRPTSREQPAEHGAESRARLEPVEPVVVDMPVAPIRARRSPVRRAPPAGALGRRTRAADPARRPAARLGHLRRRHQGRRRRRRRPERRQPHDRRGPLAGRVHRRQHGHPAAPVLGRAGEDPHRPRAHRGPRLRRRPVDRAQGGRGELRRDQAGAARLGHGLRHRRRGRRHRLRRGAGRGAGSPASSAR